MMAWIEHGQRGEQRGLAGTGSAKGEEDAWARQCDPSRFVFVPSNPEEYRPLRASAGKGSGFGSAKGSEIRSPDELRQGIHPEWAPCGLRGTPYGQATPGGGATSCATAVSTSSRLPLTTARPVRGFIATKRGHAKRPSSVVPVGKKARLGIDANMRDAVSSRSPVTRTATPAFGPSRTIA